MNHPTMGSGRINGNGDNGYYGNGQPYHYANNNVQRPPAYHEDQPLLNKIPSDEAVAYWDDEESEVERRGACRGMTLVAFFLFTILMGLRYLTNGLTQLHQKKSNSNGSSASGVSSPVPRAPTKELTTCPHGLAFCEPAKHQVSTKEQGFPSFWNYATKGPLNITYDGRSIMINGDRVLFLSGSIHPIRTTKETWEIVLDEAVKNGLNMVTIYVFWAEHQPFPDRDIDWTLPAGQGPDCETSNAPSYCGWSLADAIRSAASRGLFVHARIGPYTCAEYNYGGIPEWVALHKPGMAMRRLNKEWLQAMEVYVRKTVQYFKDNRLFAYQGGPIVIAQIENELGGEDDSDNIPIMDDDMPPDSSRLLVDDQSSGKGSTVQDYADWCGELVDKVAPKVVWTMCNGLTANNTILTCNGDCSTKWLEDHGGNGRIQIDHPAIWTEDEGGFQLWGDDSSAPTDYFWGRTARAMAYDALRWFARGGSHLNYYMWWGGYNRRRSSAAGIMNGYATDAAVCPSGHPREPKFSHFQALHKVVHDIAPILLDNPSAMNNSIDVPSMNKHGDWIYTGKQRMFAYRTQHHHEHNNREILFVENDARETAKVNISLENAETESMVLKMNPLSAVILVDGAVKFDSFAIDGDFMSYKRVLNPAPVDILGWSSCAEPIGASKKEESLTLNRTKPEEQTALNIDAKMYSDYAWYETHFELEDTINDAIIFVQSQIGSALVLFINGKFVGEAFTLQHSEGDRTFEFHVQHLKHGRHRLSILSESLGYHNLIGRWGASTAAKTKGITGDVILTSESTGNISIVDGRPWISHAGLNGHEKGYCRDVMSDKNNSLPHPTWTSAMFNTPNYDPTSHALYLDITKGRGHLWLNGHDLGRFWNITRGDTAKYSQQYYFLPPDFLESDGSVNRITFFDALGSELRKSTALILSWLNQTSSPNFKDEVDYPLACI